MSPNPILQTQPGQAGPVALRPLVSTSETPKVKPSPYRPEDDDDDEKGFDKHPRWLKKVKSLSLGEKYVWTSLDQWKWRSWHPSNEDIAEATGISLTRVKIHIKSLIKKGWLIKERWKGRQSENPTGRILIRSRPESSRRQPDSDQPASVKIKPAKQSKSDHRAGPKPDHRAGPKPDHRAGPKPDHPLRPLSLESDLDPSFRLPDGGTNPDGGSNFNLPNDNDHSDASEPIKLAQVAEPEPIPEAIDVEPEPEPDKAPADRDGHVPPAGQKASATPPPAIDAKIEPATIETPMAVMSGIAKEILKPWPAPIPIADEAIPNKIQTGNVQADGIYSHVFAAVARDPNWGRTAAQTIGLLAADLVAKGVGATKVRDVVSETIARHRTRGVSSIEQAARFALASLSPPSVDPAQRTPVQIACLESLTTDQIERFEGMSEVKKRRLLDCVTSDAGSYSPLLSEVASTPKPRPRRPTPTSASDLILSLPGGEPGWTQLAAELMAKGFGADQDRKLWGQFLKISEMVASGILPAEDVEELYSKVVADPKIEKRGAYFWSSLTNRFPRLKEAS